MYAAFAVAAFFGGIAFSQSPFAYLKTGSDPQQSYLEINPLASEQAESYRRAIAKAGNKAEQCLQKDRADIECVNHLLQELSRERGARFALDVIEPLAQKYPILAAQSHDLSHTVGIWALRRAIQNVDSSNASGRSGLEEKLINEIGRALVECDGWGAFGCYHGVIEVGLSKLSPQERTRVVQKACMENPLIQARQYYVNQCLHWFGHGMAIFTDQSLQETLAVCENLNADFGSDDVQLCLSGVFHAGSVPGETDVDFLENVSRVYDNGNVYYPCLDLAEKFRGQCFSHVPGRTGSMDMKKVFENCDNIPESIPAKRLNYIHRCYDSGANILLVNNLFDAEKVVKDCGLYAAAYARKYCYQGAVRYWILRDPLLNNPGPFEICRLAEKEAKPHCYMGLGAANYENYFSAEILDKFCGKITEREYYQDCLTLNIPD